MSTLILNIEPLIREVLGYSNLNILLSQIPCGNAPCSAENIEEEYTSYSIGRPNQATMQITTILQKVMAFLNSSQTPAVLIYSTEGSVPHEFSATCTGSAKSYNDEYDYWFSVPVDQTIQFSEDETIGDIVNLPQNYITNAGWFLGSPVGGVAMEPTAINPLTKVFPGDFTTDGTAYINLKYFAVRCPNSGRVIYNKDYQVSFNVYLYLTPTNAYLARCCSGVNVDPKGNNVCVGYSPTKFTDCNRLLSAYCEESSDPACGCFPGYIQTNIIDQDPLLSAYLSASETQFSPGCSASCQSGISWIPKTTPTCGLSLCTSEVSDISHLSPLVNLKNCGPPPSPSPPPPSPSPITPPAPHPLPPNYNDLFLVVGIGLFVFLVMLILLLVIAFRK